MATLPTSQQTVQSKTSTHDLEEGGSGQSDRYSITATMFFDAIAIILFLLITVITTHYVFLGQKPNLTVENHVYTACPEAWIEFGNRCYYFSEEIRNWTFSDSNCTSQDANLVQIETQKELDFLKRYKDNFDYWIGSFNESLNHKGQWTDQTKCTAAALIAKGAGECPYLNKDKVNLDRIYIERRWICSQPKKNICSCHIPLNPS